MKWKRTVMLCHPTPFKGCSPSNQGCTLFFIGIVPYFDRTPRLRSQAFRKIAQALHQFGQIVDLFAALFHFFGSKNCQNGIIYRQIDQHTPQKGALLHKKT